MGSITFQLMIITIVSKATGLIREMVFGAAYGTSMIKDVYVTSETVTALLFSFLFMSIQSIFIPMYNKVLAGAGRKKADAFTANLTNTLIVVSTLIIIMGMIFMEPIVKLVAAGYTGEKLETAVYFSRIRMFGIYFSAANACMISYLNIYDDFFHPAITGIISNFFLIIIALISARIGSINLLAFGTVFSVFMQYILFPRALKKAGYRHRLLLKPKHPDIMTALKMALPVMIGIVVNDLSIMIDQSIATSVATEGGVSALDYAQKIYQIISGIVIVSIVTAVYPKMSKFGQEKQIPELKKLSNSSIITGLLLVIPSTIGLMIFAEPIVRLFYERQAFDAQSTQLTAGALFWYTPGLVALVFTSLITRVFYSIGNTRTPVAISTVQVVIDIILNFVLSRLMGLNGLAASTSVGNIFAAFAYLYLIHLQLGKMHFRSMIKSMGKIILASSLMALAAYVAFTRLPLAGESIRLALVILLAIVVYSLAIILVKIPEAEDILKSIFGRFKKSKS